MMAKVAFLGLGVMGYPMAGHLKAKGGHDVTVYNRSAGQGREMGSAASAARPPPRRRPPPRGRISCSAAWATMTTCAPSPSVPDGAFHGMKKGAIFVDNTTASAEVARELACRSHQARLLVHRCAGLGRAGGRENGVLTVMCGGDAEAYATAEPVIMAFARACRLLGPSGAGQLTKMVNQICIAGLVQGLAEGVHFGKKAGLDMDAVLDVISKGAAGSWQMENRGKTMNQGKFDFGFAVDWMRKDLSIVLARPATTAPTCR
jgi:3-hydroxyisobutyrate dehydrogenase